MPISETLPRIRLSAADMWDLYADNDLLALERVPGEGYQGTAALDKNGAPALLLGVERQFRIEWTEIASYDYKADPYFSLGVYDDLPAALRAVIGAPLMAEEAIPHRAQLGLVLRLLGGVEPPARTPYDVLRTSALQALDGATISVADAGRLLRDLLPAEREYQLYKQTGLVSALHAEREIVLKAYGFLKTDPAATAQMRAVIDNARHEDAVTVQTAVWALGRHNDKSAIDDLIGMLTRPQLGYQRIAIQEALQFLCSGPELIPTVAENERAHWVAQKAGLPQTPEDWLRYDARSAFWEKRLRAAGALRARGTSGELMERLRRDEVPAVRLAAGAAE